MFFHVARESYIRYRVNVALNCCGLGCGQRTGDIILCYSIPTYTWLFDRLLGLFWCATSSLKLQHVPSPAHVCAKSWSSTFNFGYCYFKITLTVLSNNFVTLIRLLCSSLRPCAFLRGWLTCDNLLFPKHDSSITLSLPHHLSFEVESVDKTPEWFKTLVSG